MGKFSAGVETIIALWDELEERWDERVLLKFADKSWF